MTPLSYRLEMLKTQLDDIVKIRLITISVIACTVLIVIGFLTYIMGLGFSCLFKKFRNRKRTYSPTVNFKSSICKAVEDGIYFSEVSPSSDNLTKSGSLIRSSEDSSSEATNDKISKLWFPISLKSKKIGWKSKKSDQSPTTVCLNLKFVPNDDTSQCGKLHISIKHVVSLPTKDYPRYTEAYFAIKLIRVHRTFKGTAETRLYENRTKNFRNTRDIQVDEHFVLEVRKNDIKNLCVHLTAYDQDIYTKPSELASVVIPLSQKCKEICTQQEGVELTHGLKQVPKNVGNLLVGLSYLPTSQRLSVNIVKAANLPNTKDKNMRLYAQLFLLTGVTGRSLKRKKLEFKTSENDPFELNGTLSFDVTPNLLETVTLLIILYMKSNDTEKEAETEDQLKSNNASKYIPNDHCFGSIAIGKLVSSCKGKKHWRMMVMAPRRVVTVWHSLK